MRIGAGAKGHYPVRWKRDKNSPSPAARTSAFKISVKDLLPERLESRFVSGPFLRRPFLPRSNRGKRPGGHPGARTVLWLAARNQNKSPVFPETEPNGSRILPLDRSSLLDGSSCSASGSSNRVPGKTTDRPR